ncbi:MAG TPA: D-aminoacylase [Chloroflexota bacterium]|nr:D-aminoacylase [Chloroflexota bacterium]
MLDVLIRGGMVVDGTGSPWTRADVGVEGGRIVAVGNLPAAQAARTVDASGMVVSPGFIDCHSHSDGGALQNRYCESTLLQGVTTEVVGNCGSSPAPRRTGAGANYTFGEYLEEVTRNGLSANYAFLVGHGTIRRAVMGAEERSPSAEEQAAMERLLEQSLDEGAYGLSTGLEFVPGRAATLDELRGLNRVLARYDRIHATHQRNRNEGFEASVAEAIAHCESVGVRLQIAHNNARYGAPPGAWERVMGQIEGARARGLDVSCDTTTYTRGGGGMSAVLPPWLFDAGAQEAARRLGDPVIRQKVKGDMRRYWLRVADGRWDELWLGRTTNSQEYFGKSFAEIGALRGQDPLDAYLDVLMGEGEHITSAGMFGVVKDEAHLREMLTHPLYAAEADARSAPLSGPLYERVNHPASFGWTAFILGTCVREKGWLSLEYAVHKMTGLPAAKFRLHQRGLIRPGMAADLVVFDPRTIHDNASFEEPRRSPDGIHAVFVNGVLTVEGGRHTHQLAGGVLRP